MRRFVGGFRPTYESFADRVNIVDTSDATLGPVSAKISLWPLSETASRRFEVCSEVVGGPVRRADQRGVIRRFN
jgi:hypothetical protein